MRAPLISGDEYEALTKGGRRVHRFRAGIRAKVKRWVRRRERHAPIYDIEALVEQITPENRHAEIDTSPPVGNELL